MAATGVATIVEENFGSTKLIAWTWTGGTGETTITGGTTTNFYSGKLEFCVTVPAGSTEAPSDNYDITILDKNDVDVLADNGMDRATASVESILTANLGACANTQLELVVQNTGSAGVEKGYVYLWIR